MSALADKADKNACWAVQSQLPVFLKTDRGSYIRAIWKQLRFKHETGYIRKANCFLAAVRKFQLLAEK